MPKLNVQKVPRAEDRKLPIFDELDELADRIRVRAFSLSQGRGFHEGHDLDDWLAAEREFCWPAAELVEEDDEFEIKVALAGFEPEDISITATPNELIIKASHKDEQEAESDDDGKVHWSEFRSNDVYRRIALPAEIDVKKVDAELSHGMLEIEAKKARKTARKKARIKVKKAD
jgi:HSP20 family protein